VTRVEVDPLAPIRDPATKDLVWIPQVAGFGWTVISRDHEIGRKPAELRAVQEHGLRMVVLDSRRQPTTWGELDIVVRQWKSVEEVTTLAGPCVFVATRFSFRRIA